MGRKPLKLPSPAMVVACIALAVALGGSATAAVLVLQKNQVRSIHIKNGAVRSADIGNNQVAGIDINEATLAQVPSAGSAGNATTAQHAADADKLDGLDSDYFARGTWQTFSRSAGTFSHIGGHLWLDCGSGSAAVFAKNTSSETIEYWVDDNEASAPRTDLISAGGQHSSVYLTLERPWAKRVAWWIGPFPLTRYTVVLTRTSTGCWGYIRIGA